MKLTHYLSTLSALALSLSASAVLAQSVADTVFINGKIYTADTDRNIVESLAVKDSQIVSLGNNTATKSWIGKDTKVVDLQNKLMLPGLHDAHIHAVGIVSYDSCSLNNRPVDLQQLYEVVKDCQQRFQLPKGNWLVVHQWSFGENNHPKGEFTSIRQALDAAAPDNPVIMLGNDGHHNATNSRGLSRAKNAAGKTIGLNAATLRSDFSDLASFVGVDKQGEPNGAINEHVYEVLEAPSILTADIDLISQHSEQIPKRLNSLGITSIQDAAITPGNQKLYDSLIQQGDLSLRITLAQLLAPKEYRKSDGSYDLDTLMQDARTTRDKYASVDNVKSDTLKFMVDGVLEGNPLENPPTPPNAAQLRHFHHPLYALNPAQQEVTLTGYVEPLSEDCKQGRKLLDSHNTNELESFSKTHHYSASQCEFNRGELFNPNKITQEFTQLADADNFSVHFHAIGDRAVRSALDAIASVKDTDRTDHHNMFSLAHVQQASDYDIARLADLDVPVVFTFAWAIKNKAYDRSVIPFIEKVESEADMYNPNSYYYQHFYPAKSLINAGGTVVAGSDAPVETDDPRPFLNIERAITRDAGEGSFNPDENLSIDEAIAAYTINGARLMHQDRITGSLEVGKKADLIILDQNIIELANSGKADKISETQVLETWFDGKQVYQH